MRSWEVELVQGAAEQRCSSLGSPQPVGSLQARRGGAGEEPPWLGALTDSLARDVWDGSVVVPVPGPAAREMVLRARSSCVSNLV